MQEVSVAPSQIHKGDGQFIQMSLWQLKGQLHSRFEKSTMVLKALQNSARTQNLSIWKHEQK